MRALLLENRRVMPQPNAKRPRPFFSARDAAARRAAVGISAASTAETRHMAGCASAGCYRQMTQPIGAALGHVYGGGVLAENPERK